jgi:hypothetical protein
MATQKGTRAAGLTQWSERDELQMDLAHTLSRAEREGIGRAARKSCRCSGCRLFSTTRPCSPCTLPRTAISLWVLAHDSRRVAPPSWRSSAGSGGLKSSFPAYPPALRVHSISAGSSQKEYIPTEGRLPCSQVFLPCHPGPGQTCLRDSVPLHPALLLAGTGRYVGVPRLLMCINMPSIPRTHTIALYVCAARHISCCYVGPGAVGER